MCGGPGKSTIASSATSSSSVETTLNSSNKDMNHITIETEDSFSSLLEFAANDNLEAFKQLVDRDSSSIHEVGLWYCRKKDSKQIVLDHRTPLMVAATYGSIRVLEFIIGHAEVDVNFSCGMGKTTALHCAASGGSPDAVDAARLLLSVGADANCIDANGCRPVDVIVVPPKLQIMRINLEELLSGGFQKDTAGDHNSITADCGFQMSISRSDSSSPTLSSSPENGSPHSPSVLVSSPTARKFNSMSEKKVYPVDPSFPDIKNGIYSTDEFRMFCFKVRPCSRAYSHDWTECPFVHPGENARRRDPRKFHYSCVPCPDFRKGACRRGDACEYAHGVFESWLHPAQYRTRLCNDGSNCNRQVCFFAHKPEELRPLYVSTGSAVPSPRSFTSAAAVMDMAAALSMLPGSPSSVSAMSPSPFNKCMSPSANGGPNSPMAWPQPSVPNLHLPGSHLQSSRLRSSLSARDMPTDDLNIEPQQDILTDLSCLSPHVNTSTIYSRSARSKSLTPSNLEDLFSAELLSPRYTDQAAAAFSPRQRSAVFSQFHQQQSLLQPINADVFSPDKVEYPLMQGSFAVGSPGRMSPRRMDPISPLSSRVAAFTQREKQQLRSVSSRDLGSNNVAAPIVGSPLGSCSIWGSTNGKVDWSANGDEPHNTRNQSSFELGNSGEEPDFSWVQSLVKESPEMKEKHGAAPSSGTTSSVESLDQNSDMDSVIGSWLEQMQIDKKRQQRLVVK